MKIIDQITKKLAQKFAAKPFYNHNEERALETSQQPSYTEKSARKFIFL